MKGTDNHTGYWTPHVLNSIYTGVASSAGAIHIAGKVIPTVQLRAATSVPADHFNPEKISTTQSLSRPCVELAVGFTPTNGQVMQDGGEMTGS